MPFPYEFPFIFIDFIHILNLNEGGFKEDLDLTEGGFKSLRGLNEGGFKIDLDLTEGGFKGG